jgi:RHS repeat-associated protein
MASLGYYFDQELMEYHVRRRRLEASSARWLSLDPLWRATNEAFTYGSNNPLVFADPTGEIAFVWVAIIAAVVTIGIGVGITQGRRSRPSRECPPGTGPDETKALAICGGDRACEIELEHLFRQVASIRGFSKFAKYPENKCQLWCDEFLATYYPTWRRGGGPISVHPGGAVTIEPMEMTTTVPITTSSNLLFGKHTPTVGGMEIGAYGQMTGHCFFRVTIRGRLLTGTAYFDIGESTTQGEFGGVDNWFFDSEPAVSAWWYPDRPAFNDPRFNPPTPW